jgi:hypothetical protein
MTDLLARGEQAKATQWKHLDTVGRNFLTQIVGQGYGYCQELTRQDLGVVASIWSMPTANVELLCLVAIRHLMGVQTVPELVKCPKPPGTLADSDKGVDLKSLHAELVRMQARTGKMGETLAALLAEVRDFNAVVALLEVHTRPVA